MTKTLGQKVRIERATLNITQEELAKRVGVSRGYISDIERESDKINIGKDVIVALADALGVSVAYLMGLSEYPLAGMPDETLPEDKSSLQTLDTLTKEFLSIYQQLSDDKKGVLLNLAKMLRAGDEPRIIGGNS